MIPSLHGQIELCVSLMRTKGWPTASPRHSDIFRWMWFFSREFIRVRTGNPFFQYIGFIMFVYIINRWNDGKWIRLSFLRKHLVVCIHEMHELLVLATINCCCFLSSFHAKATSIESSVVGNSNRLLPKGNEENVSLADEWTVKDQKESRRLCWFLDEFKNMWAKPRFDAFSPSFSSLFPRCSLPRSSVLPLIPGGFRLLKTRLLRFSSEISGVFGWNWRRFMVPAPQW